MKLKYNQNGVTESIPLSTRKRQGKRLAIHHDEQNYYAPVVPADDSKASNLPVGVNGEIFAVQAQEPPEITSVNVAPSSVAVMQGQSATATVSAIGNEAVTGLSYGLSGAPTWITISDDVILIEPSDNDLGFANVQVYAQDTGSDAMSAAILRAEAKLRPIIESLSVIPPTVTVQQGQSAIAGISAIANEAVTGLSYSLNGASSWVNLNGDSIIAAPTDNDTGSAVMTVFAYDTNSSASAATQFTATAALRPIISSVSVNPPTVAVAQGDTTSATISAVANEAVTGLSYSLDGAPSWMNLSDSVILMTPTENDSGSAAVTVTARDTGSTAHAETVFDAEILEPLPNLTFTKKDTVFPWDCNATLVTNLYPPSEDSQITVLPSIISSKSFFYSTNIHCITANYWYAPPSNYDITLKAATSDGKRSTQTILPIKIAEGTASIKQSVSGATYPTISVQKASSGNASITGLASLPGSAGSGSFVKCAVVNAGETATLQGYVPKNASLTTFWYQCTRPASGQNWRHAQACFVLVYPKSKQTTVSSPTDPAAITLTTAANDSFKASNIVFPYTNINKTDADSIYKTIAAAN